MFLYIIPHELKMDRVSLHFGKCVLNSNFLKVYNTPLRRVYDHGTPRTSTVTITLYDLT